MKRFFYFLVLVVASMSFCGCNNEGELAVWNAGYTDGENQIYFNGIMYRLLTDNTVEVSPISSYIYSITKTNYQSTVSIPPTYSFGASDKRTTIGIGDSAFCDCTKLISVVLPSTIQYVNKDAFNNCSALTTIVCKSVNPPTIDPTAFKGCETDKITLYVALESVDAYKQNDVWKTLNVKAYAVEE